MERSERSVAPESTEQSGRLERIDGGHDERFQQAHRLRSSADFARTRQQGRRLNSPHLTLIYTRRAPSAAETPAIGAPTRIGFAISKRVGDAVRRNLVKRRLREYIRRALWKIAPGWDMIIGARPGAAQADDATLGAETLDLLARGRLLIVNHEEPERSSATPRRKARACVSVPEADQTQPGSSDHRATFPKIF